MTDPERTTTEAEEDQDFPYRELVGAVMYLMTCTRPDIAFAVGQLARNAHRPTRPDVIAAKRLLRYLQGTKNMGITLGGSALSLRGYADADYAADASSRRSTSGSVILLSDGPVMWSSRRQPCVTLSTAESEYVALSSAVQEIVWLRALLKELGFGQKEPTEVMEDNQSAIAIATGANTSRRTKHIDVRYHYVREKVKTGEIKVTYCATGDMIADVFTKPLGSSKFEELRAKVMSSLAPDREGVLEYSSTARSAPSTTYGAKN